MIAAFICQSDELNSLLPVWQMHSASTTHPVGQRFAWTVYFPEGNLTQGVIINTGISWPHTWWFGKHISTNYQSLFMWVKFDWPSLSFSPQENAKITSVMWEHKLSSARARVERQHGDCNLHYYTAAQPGAGTLIIKAKFTLWTIRIFAWTLISLKALLVLSITS